LRISQLLLHRAWFLSPSEPVNDLYEQIPAVAVPDEIKIRFRTANAFGSPVQQEIASLIRIPDSFRKIVVVRDYIKPWQDENGIHYVGIEDFLLDESFISR